MKIEINLDSKNWKNKEFFEKEIEKNQKIFLNGKKEKNLKSLVNFLAKLTLNNVLKKENESLGEIQISFLFSNNSKIQELNKEFRNQDKPTNVLAFEYLAKDDQQKLIHEPEKFLKTNEIFLGEIAVSFEKTLEESKNLEINFIDHFSHLIIHGILHLLGFDHETSEEDARAMENLEIKILSQIGIQNPYS